VTITTPKPADRARAALDRIVGRVLGADDAEPLPCRGCGVSVTRPDPERTEVVRFVWTHPFREEVTPVVTDVEVTRCDRCQDRRALADELLVEHPRVARGIGDPAVDQVDGVLAVLEVIGLPPRRFARQVADTDDGLRELLDALLQFAGAVLWSEGSRREVSPSRWAHVPGELLRDAKEAHRDLVHYLVETPRPWGPPDADGALRGCLMCGRGTLTMKRRDALEAWGDLVQVVPGTLGGADRPDTVTGYICPVCRPSVEATGAPGMPAIERALLAAVAGVKVTSGWRVNLRQPVYAWATRPAGTPTNVQPWQHLDLDRLRRNLADLEERGVVRKPLPGEAR
jgi:hypothetical protein